MEAKVKKNPTALKTTGPNSNPFSQKLVCINYPGIVNNVDKMIETLGGMGDIESYVGSQRRNMEIKFRPKDKYCKPLTSDLNRKPGILIKVVAKEPTSFSSPGEIEPDIEYEVLGVTALTYSFNRLCDFQYLPLVSEDETETSAASLSFIYNKIIPDELPEYNWIMSNELANMPLYLPPAIFSRSDNIKNCLYFDRSKFYESRFKPEYANMLRQQEMERKGQKTFAQKVISKKSGHGAIFHTFNDPTVPSAPPRLALQFLNLRYTNKGAYEEINALFEKRPVWSRSAILCVTKVPKEQLKFILPAVAYHCHNGPWRVMWVKYGYDPKKEPSSRIYQTFDFRARAAAGLKVKIRSKRYYRTQRFLPRCGTELPKMSLMEVCEKKEDHDAVNESTYILKPGMIPPARQMFYQYCDVQIPEIQSMLNRLPPVLPGTVCNIRNGWLPNKFTDQCREIANKYVTEQVQKEILKDSGRQPEEETKGDDMTANTSKEAEQSEEVNKEMSHDLLEISDTSSDSEYLPSDDDSGTSEEDVKYVPVKRIGCSTVATSFESEVLQDEGDDCVIDLEAAEDVNKMLGENIEAMEEFNRLVCDSDSD